MVSAKARWYFGMSPTHLDEFVVVHVQELVKLDTTVLVLLEGSGCLLGCRLFAGCKVCHFLLVEIDERAIVYIGADTRSKVCVVVPTSRCKSIQLNQSKNSPAQSRPQ
jgi:hypothetical protein